ncbi:MAG: ABC transporter permease [Vulcanococcus sp.]
MAHRAGRLDLGIVGLSLLVGASSSMGFIQLLAAPLENLPTSSVQVLAVQTEAFLAPLLVSLLLLLRQAPMLVTLGARLSSRPDAQRWRLWLREWWGLTLTALALVPYLMAGALVAAMLTRPELNSLEELRYLVGQLSPAMLLVSLVKSALFAAVILWISLDQGARRWRTGRLGNSALSRTIGLSIAVVLTIDLAWVLLLEPSAGGGVA